MREATLDCLPNQAIDQIQPQLRTTLVIIIIVINAFLSGCSKASRPLAEAPARVPSAPANQSAGVARLSAPETREVELAVRRVFKESALLDTAQKPAFVTGDFNGDQSQDLAVILKPDSAKLADLNEEYPAWILRDLSGNPEPRSPRLRVAADEQLLAVIHGYGSSGWRDQQATQTFLLKNAAGSSMQAQTASELRTAQQGRKLPGLRGDVVAEVRGGKTGYLYYSDASYAWYDPKTFAGDPQPRRIHGDGRRRMRN